MKKKIWIILAACLVLALCLLPILIPRGAQVGEHMGITVGMPAEKITELVPEKYLFQISRYSFYTNSYGHPVVAIRNTETDLIESVNSFDKDLVSNAPASFEKIRPGMDIVDVVRQVGLPFGCRTSGIFTLDFLSSDNEIYVIYFTRDSNGNDIVDTVVGPND